LLACYEKYPDFLRGDTTKAVILYTTVSSVFFTSVEKGDAPETSSGQAPQVRHDN
jgi:hypothetical protein